MRIQITRKDADDFIVGYITIPGEIIQAFPEENKTNGIDVLDVPDDLQALFIQESYRFKVYRKKLKHYPEEINPAMSVTAIEDELLKELNKIEKFEKLGIDTTKYQIRCDELKNRLKELL